MPTNILHLPAYSVIKVDDTDHDYHIYAEVAESPIFCPHCDSRSFVGFGRREQLIRDLPMHGKRVGIYVDTRRYKCRGCDKTFYEPLPDIDEKRLMTTRLVKWIGQQSIKRPFAHVAEEVGVNEMTVKNVFRDYINGLEKTFRFETPQWMGIDEIHIIRPRCVISNIRNNSIVEILPNRNKKTVTRYLHGLDGRDDVRYVAMDMWRPYKEAVNAVLPESSIIIDKFHVLRMANEAMEKARKSLREGLEQKQRRQLMHDRFILLRRQCELKPEQQLLLEVWTKNYPALGESYRLKEEFFGIYEGKDMGEAVRRYQTWESSIPAEVLPYFQPIITAWEGWQPEILAYFEHPVTNAYTECLNSLIRVMDRLGRGYSFEALRAKILFAEGAHKHKLSRPKFKQRRTGVVGFGMMVSDSATDSYDEAASQWEKIPKPKSDKSTQIEEQGENYGVDISTLIRMIENGEL